MIGKICGAIMVLSFIFGLANGNTAALANAMSEGAANADELTVSLVGTMCLWNGIMQVAKASGFVDWLSRIMMPILKRIFPDACQKNNGLGEISAAFSANILGIGNAATPLAIKAMKKLKENSNYDGVATADMIMFTVLGCASFDMFPTTLIALRRAAGSEAPFEIIVPVWICSVCTAVLGIILVKAFYGKKG